MPNERRATLRCSADGENFETVDVTETVELMSTEALLALREDSSELHEIAVLHLPYKPHSVFGAARIVYWLEGFLSDDETAAQYSDDPQLLSRLAHAEEMNVRLLVAGNPATPRPAINTLCRDSEASVAILAAAHLHASHRAHLHLISQARRKVWPRHLVDALISAISVCPSAAPVALTACLELGPDSVMRDFLITRISARTVTPAVADFSD